LDAAGKKVMVVLAKVILHSIVPTHHGKFLAAAVHIPMLTSASTSNINHVCFLVKKVAPVLSNRWAP
jgi:hypothetical protein